MADIQAASELELQILVTGMHLSPEFGLTYREIEEDGFRIDRKVETLMSSDSAVGVGKSVGLGVLGFADAFQDLRPDLIVILGDRFEAFAAAVAALPARIPVAHLHGGEATEGLIDDALRHSITKMAHLHFVATEAYRRRVIQMGECPEHVYNVGGLGVDSIRRVALLEREDLEKSLGFRFGKRALLVTFHPVTLEEGTAAGQMRELLAALNELKDTTLIFTMPNADTEGRSLFPLIRDFVDSHPNAYAYTSLGQRRYLSCLKHVNGVVGNSSSGLLEAPTFRIGTVNIGDRQKGRIKGDSVIDCEPTQESISAALVKLDSEGFQSRLAVSQNPYGNGGSSRRIVEALSSASLEGIVKKSFFDAS